MEDQEVLVAAGESTSSKEYSSTITERRLKNGCCASCCDPRSRLHRFIVLFFMCFLGFGSYFCYDNPGALQDNFITDLNISTAQFAQLYSWYSWPNVVLCFVGGFLLDSVFGIRLGTIIFCVFLVIGQIIFALGGLFDEFWLMIVGRFIFGIGGESLAVAQNTYAVYWFKGKELNLVFGLQMSFARVGSTVNFNLMEPLYSWISHYYTGYTCTGIVLLIAATTCVTSLLCAIVLAIFDFRAEKILNRHAEGSGETIRFSDIKDFPLTFWLMCGTCVSYYCAIFPFIGLGKVFFERKFDYDPSSANAVNSILYIIAAVASPVFGILVDKTGRNVLWVFIAVLVTIGAHGLLAFTFLNPYVAMTIMGLSYSLLASALWPMVGLVVPEYQLGTAYGIMQAVQNLGLAVIIMVAGYIVDQGGYLLLEVFFLGWLCCTGDILDVVMLQPIFPLLLVSLACTILMWLCDSAQNGNLNMSIEERDRWENNRMLADSLERDQLFASAVPSSAPSSDFLIRNRYLSRIGAALPASYDINVRGIVFRSLR